MEPDNLMMLIRKLHEHPAIWDMRCNLHSNFVAVDECWQKISEEMGISKEELQTMWKNIIHTYKLHLRRQLNPDTEADLTVIVPKDMASNILFIANNSSPPITEVLAESSPDTLINEDGNLVSAEEVNSRQLKRRRNIDIAAELLRIERAKLEIVRTTISERTTEAHFLLSLAPHLERVPMSRRLSCEVDIIETIKRYLKN